MKLLCTLVRVGAIILAACTALAAPAQPVATTSFRIFMPAFSGDPNLGLNVATVLNLRLWRTLRKAPFPNPAQLNFGDGVLVWDTSPLPDPAIDNASRALRFTNSDMVLWGSAEVYGKGVVAGTFLMTRPLREGDAPGGALWRISVNGIKAELGLPRHLFEFGTIVLRPEVVQAFSRPSALMLCPTKSITCAGKPIGSSFRATQHDGEWTRVVSETGEAGWVQLRQLGAEPNETVEFTGALASYFRGDFDQAERLFGATVGAAAADSLVREDARILKAASRSRLGRAARAQIDEILRNDPFSRYALQVAVMDALQSHARGAEGARDRILALARRVQDKEELFNPDDPWFRSVMAISRSLEP